MTECKVALHLLSSPLHQFLRLLLGSVVFLPFLSDFIKRYGKKNYLDHYLPPILTQRSVKVVHVLGY